MAGRDHRVVEALRAVYDPCCAERGVSVVDMGLLRSAVVADDGTARVELLLTSGWCPFATRVLDEVARRVTELPGVVRTDVEIVWDEAWTTDRLSDSARRTLQFLPSPAAVADRDAWLAEHLPTAPDPGAARPVRREAAPDDP